MFDDWPADCLLVVEGLRPLLCRHGANFYPVRVPRQVRVGWYEAGRKKNPWIALLTCADDRQVTLKLRVSRGSGLLNPQGPLARSPEYDRSDSERDTGSVVVGSSLPRDLPAWVDRAFDHCATRYGIQLATASPQPAAPPHEFTLPEEMTPGDFLIDGALRTVTINAYERNPEVRRQCIAAHGTNCSACGLSMGATYGPVADGPIHVHHLRPLSEVRAAHPVDPVTDLRPVCPNCHAVIHLRVPPYSIDEVRAFRA